MTLNDHTRTPEYQHAAELAQRAFEATLPGETATLVTSGKQAGSRLSPETLAWFAASAYAATTPPDAAGDKRHVALCPCPCNTGGTCGDCLHAGCGQGRDVTTPPAKVTARRAA